MFKKIVTIMTLFVIGILLIFFTSQETEYHGNPIIDNYEYSDEQPLVKEIYITILPSENKFNEYEYTFTGMNENPYEDISLEVIFQEGEHGSLKSDNYGYSLTEANASMEIRGQSSRLKEQKSYRVILDKDVESWDGYKIINLNKHPYDDIRIRNKLSFDYMKNISNITSLSTQFIHLYIKDYTEEDYSQKFIDYGLFTQVEQIDSNYMENHGLNPNGLLYKVENFEFYRYPDKLLLNSDPDYSEENFEVILEIKGDDNHEKLLEMLDAVNNQFININDVIDKYFDRENYLTWLAINILFDNIDTSSRNFFLYSPKGLDRWYFLPWDNDKGWNTKLHENSRVLWQQGVSTYWGVVLHKRFFMNEDNINDLTEKIELLSSEFSKENTKKLINSYLPILEKFLSKEPDNQYIDLEDVYDELDLIPDVIEDSKERYYESLEKPQPAFMGIPQKVGNYYIFTWTDSYDFQDDLITYDVEISNSPTFEEVIYHEENITDNQYVIADIPSGTYYWRLTINDSSGNKQTAFDYYVDEEDLWYFSIQKFIVN